jgi:ABC-type glutathione transport system ATPase component
VTTTQIATDAVGIEARGIHLSYGTNHVLRGVDLDVEQGETVAVIGESGSGKSTLARLLIGLDAPTAGGVTFDGRAVAGSDRALKPIRRETGMVFQDPYSSLDPRMTVARIVGEPLRALRVPGHHPAMVAAAIADVRLDASLAVRYPHELSGGQRQRVALARAIVHRPRLLVGDEPMSALDVTVRAQLLELLDRLRRERELTVVLVSHDLGLVQHVADRLVVMREGLIVEQGATAEVLTAPQHPYTRALIAAVPRLP